MRYATCFLFSIAMSAACSVQAGDETGSETGTAEQSLRRADRSAPETAETRDRRGDWIPIISTSGGVQLSTGDVDGDGQADIIVSAGPGASLPPTAVIPEGGRMKARGDAIGIDAARSIAFVPEGATPPASFDVPPDCDGTIVAGNRDVLICGEGIALLLPAVQKYQDEPAGATPPPQPFVVFGLGGQDLDMNILVETGGAAMTADGLAIIDGATTYAAKTKADILIETL